VKLRRRFALATVAFHLRAWRFVDQSYLREALKQIDKR